MVYIPFLSWKTTNYFLNEFVLNPKRGKVDGHRTYHFFIGGMDWYYLVSSHVAEADFRNALLRETDSELNLELINAKNDPYLIDIVKITQGVLSARSI